ncbi:hypothetical protein [Bryobacter aggregatus]|uniref:hypothetical protein n=1 Tax=Bryobacter aggregatus TaxID=360054 RepID=UPI0004E1A01E|nr:hypothetical protein [Bryobacter aggregatus]
MTGLAFWLLLALPLAAAHEGTIFYSKSFPKSKPEYLEIIVEPTGDAIYKESAEDDQPVKFKLMPEEVEKLWTLAAKVDFFQKKLESGLPVARMGEKTYRFTKDGTKNEVKFNYSQDLDAQAMQDFFERMTETVNLYFDLERTAKFEKLGVDKALLYLEAAWDKKRLVSYELYYPLLNRIIKNDSYLNMARDRAARMKAAFEEARKKPE